jgi:hypothetical protein
MLRALNELPQWWCGATGLVLASFSGMALLMVAHNREHAPARNNGSTLNRMNLRRLSRWCDERQVNSKAAVFDLEEAHQHIHFAIDHMGSAVGIEGPTNHFGEKGWCRVHHVTKSSAKIPATESADRS